MIDCKRGGFAGSIRKLARREASAHLRDSPDARRVRYSLPHRIVRRFFNIRNFTSFVCIYVLVDLTFLGAEALFEAFVPSSLSPWSALDTLPSIKLETLLLSVSGYFLAAQAGALGVITLALALVTLIAQRQTSATDIALYYHESMAFQIVASSVALLAILAAQLLWPLQLLLHRLSLGSQHFIFEFGLLGIHLAWLLMNLAAIAYFIDTTFVLFSSPRGNCCGNVIRPTLCFLRILIVAYAATFMFKRILRWARSERTVTTTNLAPHLDLTQINLPKLNSLPNSLVQPHCKT